MVTAAPPRRPRPAGRLTYTVTVDLTTLESSEAVSEIASLVQDCFVGRTITIKVDNVRPSHTDPRVAWFLGEALANGVSIKLDGRPWVLGMWRDAIGDARAVRKTEPSRRRRRHLRMVRR